MQIIFLIKYEITQEPQRPYRYINEDFLWRREKMEITPMHPSDLFIEVVGDVNTVVGQWRAYQWRL